MHTQTKHKDTYTCKHTHINTNKYIYIQTHTNTYTHKYIYIHKHTETYTNTHTNTYKYTHRQIHTRGETERQRERLEVAGDAFYIKRSLSYLARTSILELRCLSRTGLVSILAYVLEESHS